MPYGGELNDASRVPGDRSYHLDVRCNLRINMGHFQLCQELSDFQIICRKIMQFSQRAES